MVDRKSDWLRITPHACWASPISEGIIEDRAPRNPDPRRTFAFNWTSLSEALRRFSLAAQLLHAGSVTDSANPAACSLFWAAILPMELTNHIEDGPALIHAYRTDPANPLAHSAHPAGG
jgi:hypothetical protein